MTEPTDNELDIVLSKHWPAFATMGTLPLIWTRAAFREAIAKWGTPPAVAGEPVAELSVDRFTTQLLALPASHDVRPYGLHKLYTAPQPAQAQAGAVPLTEGQIESLLYKYGYDPDDEHMAAMLKEANGIKGDQRPELSRRGMKG